MTRSEYVRDAGDALQGSLVSHAIGKLLYHELASSFELLVNRDSESEARFVAEVFGDHQSERGTLLDLGCGVGRILGRLTNLLPQCRLVGVDLSLDVLQVAIGRGLRVLQGDIRCLPLGTGTVQGAYCSWSTYNYLSRPSDLEGFYDGCHRVLSPDSHLLIDSVSRPDGYEMSVNRQYGDSETRIDLRISKSVQGGVNIAIYDYVVRDVATGQESHFVDQEICRMYSIEEIASHASGRFDVIDYWNGYSAEPSSRQICLLKRV